MLRGLWRTPVPPSNRQHTSEPGRRAALVPLEEAVAEALAVADEVLIEAKG